MQAQHATLAQGAFAVAEELLLIQLLGRSHRVGQIEHDVVELLAGVGDEFQAVLDQQPQARTLEHAMMDGTEMLARDLHYPTVQLDQGDLFNRGVFECFFGRTAIAAADDQHLLGCGQRSQHRMDHGFVIDELFALRGHEAVIQTEQLAELRRVMDFQCLEGGF